MSRRRCFSKADGSDVALCRAKKNCFALPVVVVVEVVKSNISAELMPMQTKSDNALDALSFIARIYNLLRAISRYLIHCLMIDRGHVVIR